MARFPVAFGLTLGLLVAANVLANRVVPGADVLVGLALVAGLAAVAWGSGLTADDVGLARRTWGSGLRWGGAAAAIVAVGYGIAASIPAVRDAVADSSASWGATVVKALVVIPLATVIPEEFAFRGVLWGLLRRESGQRVATVVSSALFGVWHVLPALAGGAANESVTRRAGRRPGWDRVAGGRHRGVHRDRRGGVLRTSQTQRQPARADTAALGGQRIRRAAPAGDLIPGVCRDAADDRLRVCDP